MDNLVPGLAATEYGQMPPSFHLNSQRVAPATIHSELVVEQHDVPEISTEKPPPKVKPMRQPIIPRDQYDGVDSDDETDEDEMLQDDESDEDRPQVVGDMEVDMEEEEEEFLEFSRQALGITDEQWQDIVRDRQGRGGKRNVLKQSYMLT